MRRQVSRTAPTVAAKVTTVDTTQMTRNGTAQVRSTST